MISPEEERENNAYWERMIHPTPKSPTTMTEAQQRAYDQAQVMLAFSQGKKIQAKHYSNHEWRDFMDSDSWNWNAMDYRIALEPQEVWLWVKEGVQGGQVYDVGSGIKDKFMHGQGYTKKLFREVC